MLTIANVEQALAWDGQEGGHWAEHAERYDTASRRTWQRFLDAGLILERDQVLDIGCGNGKSTRDAARIVSSGSALGVDLSAAMLALARQRSRAEGLTNVSFVQADAQVHHFDDNAFGAHWPSGGACPSRRPVSPAPSASLTPTGFGASWARPGSTTSTWTRSRSRSSSAPTRRTPSASCGRSASCKD